MSKFNVGDRVVVVSSPYEVGEDDGDPNLSIGNAGTVIETLSGACALRMDSGPRHINDIFGEGWVFFDEELRPENEAGESHVHH